MYLLLWVLIFIHSIGFFLVWFLLVAPFFIPAAKIFEWLVLTEVTRTKSWPRMPGFLAKVLTWPLWLRLGIAMATIVGAWLLVLGIFIPMKTALEIIAWIFGLHFALVVFVVGVRKVRTRVGQFREGRRHQRSQQQQAMAPAEQG
jgi:hypothetical protein